MLTWLIISEPPNIEPHWLHKFWIAFILWKGIPSNFQVKMPLNILKVCRETTTTISYSLMDHKYFKSFTIGNHSFSSWHLYWIDSDSLNDIRLGLCKLSTTKWLSSSFQAWIFWFQMKDFSCFIVFSSICFLESAIL